MLNKALIAAMTMAAALVSSGNWPAAAGLAAKVDQLAELRSSLPQPRETPEMELQREEVREEFHQTVGSSRVDLQACKLEYSIVSPK